MATLILMKQKATDITKEVPVGFSWTTFFFVQFVPLFRGEIGRFFLTIFTYPLTLGAMWVYDMFKGNENYMNRLVMKGYHKVK